ncbi:hypothetical protein TGAM01_v205566 [Trichoderma gamsii]|uniref:Uncharacterized protein n=1 Tax=Trichoderma gamsii TaxID=398673 RepID=A0A2P4ZN03_9HYPO|nr:hypothetical protein TGAM01_v205566 [Trichoderma gamsii]PON25681.1 hypothetical protein TGAM01_v205566 [Trichoderma gamsii]
MGFYPIEPSEMSGETPRHRSNLSWAASSGRGWRPARLIDPGHWPCRQDAPFAVRIATGHVGMLPVSLAFALVPIMCDPCGPQSARHPSMIWKPQGLQPTVASPWLESRPGYRASGPLLTQLWPVVLPLAS